MKKVLIVDDMQGWLKYHKENLENSELKIDTANSAREAYELIFSNVKNPYDAIITDLQMESDFLPDLAGVWLIKQIQMLNSYYKTKITIISGTCNIKTIAERLNVFYVPKSLASSNPDIYRNIL